MGEGPGSVVTQGEAGVQPAALPQGRSRDPGQRKLCLGCVPLRLGPGRAAVLWFGRQR